MNGDILGDTLPSPNQVKRTAFALDDCHLITLKRSIYQSVLEQQVEKESSVGSSDPGSDPVLLLRKLHLASPTMRISERREARLLYATPQRSSYRRKLNTDLKKKRALQASKVF